MSVHEFPDRPGTTRIELPVSDVLARLPADCAVRRGMTVAVLIRMIIEKEMAAEQLLLDRAAASAPAPGSVLEQYGYQGISPSFFEKEAR